MHVYNLRGELDPDGAVVLVLEDAGLAAPLEQAQRLHHQRLLDLRQLRVLRGRE